jgi:hypothetical protein
MHGLDGLAQREAVGDEWIEVDDIAAQCRDTGRPGVAVAVDAFEVDLFGSGRMVSLLFEYPFRLD